MLRPEKSAYIGLVMSMTILPAKPPAGVRLLIRLWLRRPAFAKRVASPFAMLPAPMFKMLMFVLVEFCFSSGKHFVYDAPTLFCRVAIIGIGCFCSLFIKAQGC